MHRSRRIFICLVGLGSLALGTPLWAILPEALAQRLGEANPPKIIDVRATHDFETAHIPGAFNIPLEVLSRRKLPPFGPVVVVADGQGVVDAASAVALLRQREGIQPEVLEGGFAAWEGGQRATTRRSGLSLETLPAITYSQLLAAKESDVVLVDLREPAESKAPTPSSLRTTASVAVAHAGVDPIAGLAQKMPGARLARDPFAAPSVPAAAAPVGRLSTTSGSAPAGASAGSPASAALQTTAGVPPLLVLIDNNDGRAQEVARLLLASGNRRFVILSGGLETVRLEGRSMVERSGGTISLGGGSTP